MIFNLVKTGMMKRIYIVMAVLATALLASCEKEKSSNDANIGENALVISMKGSPSTRSMESGAFIEKGATINLGKDEDGNSFILEETIEDLNAAWMPATKGTPVYTGNVRKLYNEMGVHTKNAGTENSLVFYPMDEEMVNNGWRYQGAFTWGDKDNYDFYLTMPTTDNGITGTPTYGTTGEGENKALTITFTYASENTAAAQKDLIFAARNITKTEAQNNRVNGVPVLFNHVLTGVKFSAANYISGEVEGTKTYIKQIKFTGLANGGTCTVTPATENAYRDNTTNYSSATAVNWSVTYPEADSEFAFTQTFTTENYGSNVYSSHYDYENGGKNDGYFPDDFYATDAAWPDGTKRTTDWNINDKDASLTFWFVPQDLTDDVQMEVTFYIQAGSKKCKDIVKTIDFGTELNNAITKNSGGKTTKVTWQAGELRTYVLKATEVGVTVEDEISADGQTKTMIAVRNTGNVPEWVRATITAYWADAEGNAVYGYTHATANNFLVPWDLTNELTPTSYVPVSPTGTYGTFTGFDSSWVLGQDGYYYYTGIIGVDEAATKNIFTSYAVDFTPDVYMLDRRTLTRHKVDVHLEMKIVVQAIMANAKQFKDAQGNYRYEATETYQQAWADAQIVE